MGKKCSLMDSLIGIQRVHSSCGVAFTPFLLLLWFVSVGFEKASSGCSR